MPWSCLYLILVLGDELFNDIKVFLAVATLQADGMAVQVEFTLGDLQLGTAIAVDICNYEHAMSDFLDEHQTRNLFALTDGVAKGRINVEVKIELHSVLNVLSAE